MKKMTVTLLLLLAFVGSGVFCQAGTDNGSWKKLRKMKTIGDIKFFRDDVVKETKIMSKLTDRKHGIDMSPIRAALEKAGIDEPVTVEVRYRSRLIERLGSYSPQAEGTGIGNGRVSFDSIPNAIQIYYSFDGVRLEDPMSAEHKTGFYKHYQIPGDSTSGLIRPTSYHLVFKNAKGKIKAKLKATFTRLSM